MQNEKLIKIINDIKKVAELDQNSRGFRITIDDLIVDTETWDDLQFFHEIFFRGDYNYVLYEKTIVIDIGMNIGLASLYFARSPSVIKVYAYEPFKPTYLKALHNFNLNQSVKKKIFPYAYGLSNKDGSYETEYAEIIKGSNSIEKINVTESALYDDSQKIQVTKEKIEIRQASRELLPVVNEAIEYKYKIIVKMDCEESEYKVLQDLDDHSLLKNIESVIIEWHNQGPKDIEKILIKNHYKIYSFFPNSKTTGYLFGVNIS